MKTNIQKRRQVRALEAKRDKLLETQQKARQSLVTVRAEIKSLKKR